jgi:NAD-dependent deacetylase sirtuin 4
MCELTLAGIYTRNKNYKPIMYQEFISKHSFRQRYWARSFYGFPTIAAAVPNPTHHALTKLEQEGWLSGLVTQNVDGLQQKSGAEAERILELHGTLGTVKCIHCGHTEDRAEFQHQLEALNQTLWPSAGPPTAPPLLKESTESIMGAEYVGQDKLVQDEAIRSAHLPAMGRLTTIRPPQWKADAPSDPGSVPAVDSKVNPDGDMDLVQDFSTYKYPACPSCSQPHDPNRGVMKPDVVFFGENIPNAVKQRSFDMLDDSNGILVVGSSLAVFSAFRLIKHAKETGKPVAILNLGTTRGDPLADLKIDAPSTPILQGVVKNLT